MGEIKSILSTQYSLVKESRAVLFDYCAEIQPGDLFRASPDVGNGGSIRNLLVHICNSYFGWMSRFAFGEPFNKRDFETVTSLEQCAQYFEDVNSLVARFLDAFEDDYMQMLNGRLANRDFSTTPLRLLMHVTTHEFHHKGQILALSRMWGYTPVDTDVLR
jgi:uncharacterized damage-inducible protein DinB